MDIPGLSETLSYTPLYILITLFLGYIIWSKYLNKNNLGIKNVNDILKILFLSFILLWTFFSISFSFLFISNYFKTELNISVIWNMSKYMIIASALIALLVISTLANKNVGKRQLDCFLYQVIIGQFTISILILSLIFAVTILNLTHIIIILSLFLLIQLLFTVFFTSMIEGIFEIKIVNFIKKDWMELEKTAAWLIIIPIMLLLLTTPYVETKSPIEKRYILITTGGPYFEAYLNNEITATIRIPLVNLNESFLPQISVNYNQADFSMNDSFAKNRFIIKVVYKNNHSENLVEGFDKIVAFNERPKNGILSIDKSSEPGKLIFKVDALAIEEKKISAIEINGLSKVNLNPDLFDYQDNSAESSLCAGNKCNFVFTINNSLNLPTEFERDFITNLNNFHSQINSSKCRFTDFQYIVDFKSLNRTSCSENRCQLELLTDRINKFVDIDLVITEERILESIAFEINKPMILTGNVSIDCN